MCETPGVCLVASSVKHLKKWTCPRNDRAMLSCCGACSFLLLLWLCILRDSLLVFFVVSARHLLHTLPHLHRTHHQAQPTVLAGNWLNYLVLLRPWSP